MAQVPRTSRVKKKETTEDSEAFVRMLHDAAICGNKRKVKKLLKSGMNVDHPNTLGQTPLFLACFEGQRRLAKLLLKRGANPNVRNLEGSTPVHAASFTADLKLIRHLLDAGGDLRLHDNSGRSPRDWAARQPDAKKRKTFLDFVDEVKSMANYSSGMVPSNKLSTRYPAFQKFQKRQQHFQKKLSPSFQNFGYGLVYEGRFGYNSAVRGFIPVIPESHLKHDNAGPTYNNGQFMVMESMIWKNIPVTVKRLHRTVPVEDACVDLLIQELECVSCLQHPNILLLMAACQNNSMEGVVLLYEKVRCGSLDAHLYQRGQTLVEKDIYKIFYQISNGLVYLHQRGIIHCCLTSHAIQLVLPSYAKLSNFEYARERVSRKGLHSENVCVRNMLPKYAYNWMSPELLSAQGNLNEESDVYSLTAVLWEVLSGMPPWCGKQPEDIVTELVTNKHSLPLGDIHSPFDDLLMRGLNLDPVDRVTAITFHDLMWQGLRTNVSDPQLDSNDHQSSPEQPNVIGLSLCDSSLHSGRRTYHAVCNRSYQETEQVTSDRKFASKTSENQRLAEHNKTNDPQDPQSVKKTGSLGGLMDTRKLERMRDQLVELEKAERPKPRLNSVPHPSPTEQDSTDKELSELDLRGLNSDVDEPDDMQLVDTSRRQTDLKMVQGQYTARQRIRNVECDGDPWKIDLRKDWKVTEKSDLMERDQHVYCVHEMEKDQSIVQSQSGGDAEVVDHSNPFLDQEMKKQSEELCKQLMNQPVPKLPFPPKLISSVRPCDGESIHKPTVYGTILRQYSQNRRSQLFSKRNSLQPPTFGISLTELKAAVMPHASSGVRGAFRRRRDSTYGPFWQPGINISSSYQSSSKSNLDADNRICTFKPASHREPSLNISPSKHSLCTLQNFSIPPPPSSTALSSSSYLLQAAEPCDREDAVGFRRTFPRRTSYNVMAMALYDHPDKDESDSDMIRFKSDPLLQRKIYMRQFLKGETPLAKSATLDHTPHNRDETSEDLEEDDNLEELIGRNWDGPQQAGSMPPRHSWWTDAGVGRMGASQGRFTLNTSQKHLVKDSDSERQRNIDDCQQYLVKDEAWKRERSSEEAKRNRVVEEDLKRETIRDRNRDGLGDKESDRVLEHLHCQLCNQELSPVMPKACQLSRIDSSNRLSLKSTAGRTDPTAGSNTEGKSPFGGKPKIDRPQIMNSSKQQASVSNMADFEEFYFDDDLHSTAFYKEKYMRLQSTMAMDSNSVSTPHALSSFASPTVDPERSATALGSTSLGRERTAGIHVAGKSIPGSISATKSLDASNTSRKTATCPEKWLMATHSHNMSTITVESDSQGHHRICLKKVDPLTGTESTTYKASVVADQVITQVFLGDKDDRDDDQVKDDDDDDNEDNTEDESDSCSSDSEKPYLV